MARKGYTEVDVVIVGAGFAGLYQLYRLRKAGFRAIVLEAADDVGGTWYWNRYPGARCDILSIDYSYSWDPDLEQEWEWSERYATQPEILRYIQFVANKHDLRRDIVFNTRVESGEWHDSTKRWTIRTNTDAHFTARFYVMATGCLSIPKVPDIEGLSRFKGEVYFTNNWPHDGVDFTGQRVAVIGTGSSAMQAIPIIAEQAAHLTVFQRTPNFSMPAHNGPISEERLAKYRKDPRAYREAARWSVAGVPRPRPAEGALMVSDEERNARYEAMWEAGELLGASDTFNDIRSNPTSNGTLRDFIHGKIRAIVDDEEVAALLCPKDYYVGSKRVCLDTNYHATFNLPHVRLIDLRSQPITTITETGIDIATDTDAQHLEFDAIVFATGFDAMTGAILAVDMTGRDGIALREKWAAGPVTYLGMMTTGFPNLFMITGPGSPSVFSNMVVSIEQHVDWVTSALEHVRKHGFDTIEPTELAETHWVRHNNEVASLTLMPSGNSWYTGANIPGKPKVFVPYLGGVDQYRAACDEVIERSYLGFVLAGPDGVVANDGIIRELKPDVAKMLRAMAELGLPPIESMSVAEARAFMEAAVAKRPRGPEVGQVVDDTLPGADGSLLNYRLYRPASPGPHPIVVYFHAGGWVLGSHTSDDAVCRDLCVRSDTIIVSVDYRLAPDARFPAAADDGLAAVRWIAENAGTLGGRRGQLAVAGFSAGANLAAVTCQQARHEGGPSIAGQLLVNPVTDCNFTTSSYVENAEGYILTRPLMEWFWDHYCDPGKRNDPKASPLRADDLSGLPPAMVVTCQFDPLRDEGDAYAEALAEAGVPVQHLQCEGQTHTSLGAVGVVVTGEYAREEMAKALRSFFDTHQNRPMSELLDDEPPIAVIGAGLGGLSVAIGLLQKGFRVRVYEQADAFGEVGAGISISPNASKIFAAWGLDERLAEISCTPLVGTVLSGMTGEALQSQPLGDELEKLFGSPYYQLLRPQLHALLVDEVRRLDADAFRLGHRLVDIAGPDDAPVLEFANGATAAASLIIAADGARSVVRSQRFVDEPARFTRHIAYRGVLPTENLPARYREPRAMVWLGDRCQLVHYPVADYDALNVVAFVSDVDWDVEGWHERAELSELQAVFAGFCDEARAVLDYLSGHELFKWALYDREPVDEWVRGRLVLMGDAAHPMLPYLGQGAAMAIEDAWVLSSVLANHERVDEALVDYQQRRVERAKWVLLQSREQGKRYHEPGQDSQRFSGDAVMHTQKLFAPGPTSLLT